MTKATALALGLLLSACSWSAPMTEVEAKQHSYWCINHGMTPSRWNDAFGRPIRVECNL